MSDQGARFEPLLQYWFGFDQQDPGELETAYERWFAATPEADAQLRARFGALAAEAASGRLADWKASARGRLALILLLDQLPRNLHRGSAAAFTHDAEALGETLEGIRVGADRALTPLERAFFYMPLQHAESIDAQRASADAFESLAREPVAGHVAAKLNGFAAYARVHRDIIERFGRFPHRNRVLGRPTTSEELEFLEGGGPTFGQ